MKRVPNYAAVQTLLSTMNPDAEVRILNIPNWWALNIKTGKVPEVEANDKQVYKVSDILYKWSNADIARATILRTSVGIDGKLVIVIDTKTEVY